MCRRADAAEGFNAERQSGLAAREMSASERLQRLGHPGWSRTVYSGSVHPTVEAARGVL